MYIVGKYNIDNLGESFEGKDTYNKVVIYEFDSKDKEVSRKAFHFKGRVPKFETEQQVEVVYSFPSNSRLIIAPGLFIKPYK